MLPFYKTFRHAVTTERTRYTYNTCYIIKLLHILSSHIHCCLVFYMELSVVCPTRLLEGWMSWCGYSRTCTIVLSWWVFPWLRTRLISFNGFTLRHIYYCFNLMCLPFVTFFEIYFLAHCFTHRMASTRLIWTEVATHKCLCKQTGL